MSAVSGLATRCRARCVSHVCLQQSISGQKNEIDLTLLRIGEHRLFKCVLVCLAPLVLSDVKNTFIKLHLLFIIIIWKNTKKNTDFTVCVFVSCFFLWIQCAPFLRSILILSSRLRVGIVKTKTCSASLTLPLPYLVSCSQVQHFTCSVDTGRQGDSAVVRGEPGDVTQIHQLVYGRCSTVWKQSSEDYQELYWRPTASTVCGDRYL
jgi:hypothetical protein